VSLVGTSLIYPPGGGAGGIQSITSSDGSLVVTNPAGPVVDLTAATSFFSWSYSCDQQTITNGQTLGAVMSGTTQGSMSRRFALTARQQRAMISRGCFLDSLIFKVAPLVTSATIFAEITTFPVGVPVVVRTDLLVAATIGDNNTTGANLTGINLLIQNGRAISIGVDILTGPAPTPLDAELALTFRRP